MNIDVYDILRKNIKKKREKLGLTQAELAEKSARLAELDALLNMDEHVGGEELCSDGEMETKSRPSVLAELKERASHIPSSGRSDAYEEVL